MIYSPNEKATQLIKDYGHKALSVANECRIASSAFGLPHWDEVLFEIKKQQLLAIKIEGNDQPNRY